MNLEIQSFFKGDSYDFSYFLKYEDFPNNPNIPKVNDTPTISGWGVLFYGHNDVLFIESNPLFEYELGTIVHAKDVDGGALITINLPYNFLENSVYNKFHYKIKIYYNNIVKTISTGIIQFKSFYETHYINEFRRFLKDIPTLNTGEFYNAVENSDKDLERYLRLTVNDFNNSYYTTSFTLDNFPDEKLLYIGALLNALISNGILNARCALTWQDAGGITVMDKDRWGRYMQFFQYLMSLWSDRTVQIKRSLNIESVYGELPSEMSITGSYLDSRPGVRPLKNRFASFDAFIYDF